HCPAHYCGRLFMEDMDSSDRDFTAGDCSRYPHHSLALKLAVTSYLLSLAIFIPADRFGARTVFRAAIAIFVLGAIGCALSGLLPDFVRLPPEAGAEIADRLPTQADPRPVRGLGVGLGGAAKSRC